MKIQFERPNVPNFIKTDKGRFDIKDLNKEELEDLKIEFGYALEDNWRRRRNAGISSQSHGYKKAINALKQLKRYSP